MPINPYTRLDRKHKEVFTRLVGILMKRKLLPKRDADYILEPYGEKAADGFPGMVFYDEEGKRIS